MSYMIPSKYTVYSPFTSPESYNPAYHPSENKVRCLFIPSEKYVEPLIITDYSSVILDTFFEDHPPAVLPCVNNFHVYYDPYLQWSPFFTNHIATSLIRNDTLHYNGNLLTDSICGNVLVFGTINPLTNQIENKDYSVPYEIIEQAVRINEAYIQRRS